MTSSSSTPSNSVKLTLREQERLLEQFGGNINECSSPNCKRLTPSTTCSICIKEQKQETAQKPPTTCVIEGCNEAAYGNSNACSPQHRTDRKNYLQRKRRAELRAARRKAQEETQQTATPAVAAPTTTTNTTSAPPPTPPQTDVRTASNHFAKPGDSCHVCGIGFMELRRRRHDGRYFFGCNRFFRRNRKNDEDPCKGTAQAAVQQAGEAPPPVTVVGQVELANDTETSAETTIVMVPPTPAEVQDQTLQAALQSITQIRHSLRQLERMVENNSKTLNEVRRTMDNIDARSEEALQGVNTLTQQLA